MIDKVIRGRRSVRIFQKKPITWEKIEEIIEAGSWAPSACNMQGWEFVVVIDQNLKKKICREAGTQRIILNAPVSVVALYDSRFDFGEEQHAGIQSVAAAIENMLLKAHELGVGSLWMTSIKKPERLREIIKAPPELFPIAIILLGYQKFKPLPPSRRPLSEILHKNYCEKTITIPSTLDLTKWNEAQIKEFQQRYVRARSGKLWKYLNPQEKKILNYLVDNYSLEKTLDVLSGPGHHLLILAKKTKELSFCERSKELIDFVQNEIFNEKMKPNGYIVEKTLPFPRNVFDTVVCFEKLEQVPDPSFLLKEIYRVLGPDGRSLVVVRNKFSFFGPYVRLHRDDIKFLLRYFGPVQPMSPKTVHKLAKKAGFISKLVAGVGLSPSANKIKTGPGKGICKLLLFELAKK